MPTADGGHIRRISRPSDISEFRMFIETLRTLGIKFSIDWQATKSVWQDDLLTAGYNLTALACCAVQIGNVEYLFSNGQAHWEGDHGFGPSGAFLLSKDRVTGEVQRRVYYNLQSGNEVPAAGTGLSALRAAYRF